MRITTPVLFGTPGLTLGTANAAGSVEQAVRIDGTLLAFDTTAPTAVTSGVGASAGSATVATRRDHTHGGQALQRIISIGAVGVATTETTTSATYADLATSGPATNMNPGVTTNQFVFHSCQLVILNPGEAVLCRQSVALSGATALDANSVGQSGVASNGEPMQAGNGILVTNVASGAYHTCKYKSDGTATASFLNRRIIQFTLN